MNAVESKDVVTGVYLIDSWLKDTRLAITGYDFTRNLKDNAMDIAGLRITSIALRALGVALGRYCITCFFSGNLLLSIPLFVLSHDFIVMGNNLSNGIKVCVDDLLKGDLFRGVKKITQVIQEYFDDTQKFKKDLAEIKFEVLWKEVKVGTIMEGWKETYSFLTANDNIQKN